MDPFFPEFLTKRDVTFQNCTLPFSHEALVPFREIDLDFGGHHILQHTTQRPSAKIVQTQNHSQATVRLHIYMSMQSLSLRLTAQHQKTCSGLTQTSTDFGRTQTQNEPKRARGSESVSGCVSVCACHVSVTVDVRNLSNFVRECVMCT